MNVKNKLRKAKRIVVKIGTNTLSTKDGKMALSRIYGFIEDIAELRWIENGKYVHCIEVLSDSVSVDNHRDIAKVENIMKQRGMM